MSDRWLDAVTQRDFEYRDITDRTSLVDDEFRAAVFDRRDLLALVVPAIEALRAYEKDHANNVNIDNFDRKEWPCGCLLCVEADRVLAMADAARPPTTEEE